MSELYDSLCERIDELRSKGVEPDRVVVPSKQWQAVKTSAEVVQDPDVFGGEKTLVNGVRATHNHPPTKKARLLIEVPSDE